MSELRFPKNFLWGAATASYQVEGGIENNDWAQAAREGKVPAAGKACDSYNRYEEDFGIAKLLGHNAHRFSIEWARIEPEEGKFDQEAIEHYRKVLRALRDRGLEPMVTLWHFTLPIWFSKMGGFENPKSPEIFARYCEHVVSQLGDSAKFWMTINEYNIYSSHGYLKGIWPPFKKSILKFIKVRNNLVMSHNMTYRRIKELNKNLQVGIAHNMIDFQSNWNPINVLISKFADFHWNIDFVNKIAGHLDLIGVNNYYGRRIGNEFNLDRTEYMNWPIYPAGIHNVLVRLKKYNLPVYITENGLADAKDQKRAKFIKEYLAEVHRAIQDGVDVQGYMYWSLLDNFEWAHGFGPRFGLVEMNYDTMERQIRPSAYEYKRICESNELTL